VQRTISESLDRLYLERSLGQYDISTKGVAHGGEAKITAESLVKVDAWELNKKIWDFFVGAHGIEPRF